MKITPLDIQEQKFKMSFRGYDRDEVNAFLDDVSKGMEDLIRENSYIKEELERLNGEIEKFKDMEETLKGTIISAQKMSEDFKDNAKKEAENMINAARNQAEKIILNAEKRLSELNSELSRVSGRITEIKEIVRGIMNGFLENMDNISKA